MTYCATVKKLEKWSRICKRINIKS